MPVGLLFLCQTFHNAILSSAALALVLVAAVQGPFFAVLNRLSTLGTRPSESTHSTWSGSYTPWTQLYHPWSP